MSMPALQPKRWTEDAFFAARDAAPAGERWELVDGEVLVTPSPHWRHQGVVGALLRLLHDYVRQERVGNAFAAPLDVRLVPGLVLQPDVLVVPARYLADHEGSIDRLLLAAEVLSPSSIRFDRVVKRTRYQRERVPEYWILDPDAETIERWQADDARPAVLTEDLVWQPDGAAHPLVVDIPALFRDAKPL